jgi:hypothetical protein
MNTLLILEIIALTLMTPTVLAALWLTVVALLLERR